MPSVAELKRQIASQMAKRMDDSAPLYMSGERVSAGPSADSMALVLRPPLMFNANVLACCPVAHDVHRAHALTATALMLSQPQGSCPHSHMHAADTPGIIATG
jgi:hypothetical protein